jgi:TPR repeat protein
MYERGQGVPQDYAMAREWYKKSAMQGSIWGQKSLGMLYAAGKGGPKDIPEAFKWLKKATYEDNPVARRRCWIFYDLFQRMLQGEAINNLIEKAQSERYYEDVGPPQDPEQDPDDDPQGKNKHKKKPCSIY